MATLYLTRIANNQIQANTIHYSKLQDYTLVGQKFNPNMTLNSNITVQGNLTVQGSYITTTSTNTNINDPLVIFNSSYQGAPTYDIGMLINRNLATLSPTNYGGLNAAWVWREDEESFEGVLTTETGTTAGIINRTAFANLIIGNTIIKTTVGEVVDSTDTASGALQVQGGVGITANLNVGVDNNNWNKLAGNSYFGTTDLTYPSGNQPASQQAIQNIKTFAGSAFNLALVNSDASAHATFTQNTTAQGGQLSVVTYQSGNDINFAPNGFFAVSMAAANGSVIVQPTTDSEAANPYTTGALIVQGGTAIQGNLNVQGNVGISDYTIGGANGVLGQFFATRGRTTDLIGDSSVVIGNHPNAQAGSTVGDNAVVVGGNIAGASAASTLVGYGTQDGGFGTTAVGFLAGGTQTSGGYNTYLGFQAGANQSGGAWNVILGSYDGLTNPYYPLETQGTSYNVVVADGSGNIRIWVDPAGTTRFVSNTIATHADPTSGAVHVVGGLSVLGNIQIGGNAIAMANGLVFGGNTGSAGGRIYIGGNVLTDSVGGSSITIGNYAANNGTEANVTIVGDNAGRYFPGDSDVLVGRESGKSHTGNKSTMVGTMAGKETTGSLNQFFGYNSGSLVTTGANNTILGAFDGNAISGGTAFSTAFNTNSNQVAISDGEGNPRVYIDNNGSLQIIGTENSNFSYGALRVEGGASIAKDLYVDGNTTLTGNLTVLGEFNKVNSTILTVTDPILELNTGPNGAVLGSSVNFDSGIKTHHWYAGADRFAFFGRADDDGEFEYYAAVTSESGNVITGTYGNIKVGGIHLANAYNAVDKSGTHGRGAITTLGGASIALDTYIGGHTYNSGQTNTGNYTQTTAGTTFNVAGTSTITLNPDTAAQVSTIDNIAIGQSTPANGKFSNLVVSSDGTGYNFTVQGSGFANISPTGAVKINPTSSNGQSSNMDNVYIGNITPRQGHFTAVNVGQDLLLEAFSANSVLFLSPSGNLSVDQHNLNFNYQRNTGNTFSSVQLSIGTNGDFTGSDTINMYYQGDSYVPQSGISANVLGQTPGWTVATSRGTGHSPTTVNDGDFVGLFGAYAYTDIGDYQEIGAWRYVVTGDNTTGNGLGGEAQLWTKLEGVDGGQLALRVDQNRVATFYGQVAVANTTPTLNSTTGSFYSQGGISTSGNIVAAQGLVINESQSAGKDTYIRGYNDATLIWATTTTGYDQVVIGNSATQSTLVPGAKFQVNSTDSMLLPRGSDGDRPSVPQSGMVRWNYIAGDIEWYNGSTWFQPSAGAAGIILQDIYNGDGITTDFGPLKRSVTSNSAWVSINGVIQIPGVNYAYDITSTPYANGKTLHFYEAPEVGDIIDVREVTIPYEARGVNSLNTYVGFDALDQYTGANVTVGETQSNTSVTFLNDGAVAYYGMGNILVDTSTATLHSFMTSKYRSAKYYIQVSNPALGEFETSEVMVIHNGTTVTKTQYARIHTGASSLGTVGATLSSGNVSLTFTGINSGNYIKVRAEYTAI